MRRTLSAALVGITLGSPLAFAKKKEAAPATAPAAPAPKIAGEQTSKAVLKLMGNFKWGMTSAEAIKQVTDGLSATYNERIKAEHIAAKQDAIRAELNEALAKLKDGHVLFDGHKTGWDVSLVDKEFAHGNDESMLVLGEKDQRRFLFFWNDKLWKQFVAFNADHEKFKGKSFDDFSDIIQGAYGPSSVTFKKQRTSDEQTFDHLEWKLAGDFELWAIDMTTLYNNFCLSVMQKSVLPEIERSRKEHSQDTHRGSQSLVDAVTQPEKTAGDENVDIVEQITGRSNNHPPQGSASTPAPSGKTPAKSSDKKKPAAHIPDSTDPLGDTGM